jgi:hypothetical protein
MAVLQHERAVKVARFAEILETRPHLRLGGGSRNGRDLELAQLPILAVDEHVPVDAADLAFRRLLSVLVEQSRSL